jgi:hypothetical protein
MVLDSEYEFPIILYIIGRGMIITEVSQVCNLLTSKELKGVKGVRGVKDKSEASECRAELVRAIPSVARIQRS